MVGDQGAWSGGRAGGEGQRAHLAGTYDPHGAGKVLFVVFAAMAEVEREFIHERTLVGLDTAAANGKHGGRPPAADGDVLAVALRRRDAKESVTTIASHLGVGAPPGSFNRDTPRSATLAGQSSGAGSSALLS